MSIVKVQVTKEHIEQGRAGLPHFCPVALALQATGIPYVSVGSRVAWFSPETATPQAKLPHEARRFIKLFDAGQLVPSSFEFEIDIPDEVLA